MRTMLKTHAVSPAIHHPTVLRATEDMAAHCSDMEVHARAGAEGEEVEAEACAEAEEPEDGAAASAEVDANPRDDEPDGALWAKDRVDRRGMEPEQDADTCDAVEERMPLEVEPPNDELPDIPSAT